LVIELPRAPVMIGASTIAAQSLTALLKTACAEPKYIQKLSNYCTTYSINQEGLYPCAVELLTAIAKAAMSEVSTRSI